MITRAGSTLYSGYFKGFYAHDVHRVFPYFYKQQTRPILFTYLDIIDNLRHRRYVLRYTKDTGQGETEMKHATLPDGTSVSVSLKQEDWWFENDATGYVHPSLLAPDPGQPRKAIGGGDWKEFRNSIKIAGVREHIRITPRTHAPWVKLAAGDQRPFIINSGHRRHLAATVEKLAAVPVIIKIYASQADYERDAVGLNRGRKDLAPLEEALVIQQGRKRGDTWETIAADLNLSLAAVQKRAKLVNLAPEIKMLIDPDARQGTRSDFPIGVAEALGSITDVEAGNFLEMMQRYELSKEDIPFNELDGADKLSFGLQRALFKRIEEQGMHANQAIEFIKNGKVKHDGYLGGGGQAAGKTYGRSPANIFKMLNASVKVTSKSSIVTLTRDMIRAACADKSAEEVKALMKDAVKSAEELGRVLEILNNLYDAKHSRVIKPLSTERSFDPGRSLLEIDPDEAARIAAKYGAILKS